MKNAKRKISPDAGPDAIRRKFEDMGLGSEEERRRYRELGDWPNYGHIPNRGARGARRFAGRGDIALAAMRRKLEEYRRA